jgi:hypothetical protein
VIFVLDVETEITLAEEAVRQSSILEQSDSLDLPQQLELLEERYHHSPDDETKLLLLGLYAVLSRGWSGSQMRDVVKFRERFLETFPDHFDAFMASLRSGQGTLQWPGCLRCRHSGGSSCSVGAKPQRLASRYLNVDYHCSLFEKRN